VSQTGPAAPGGAAIFFGCLLIAIGALMALLCGACTALAVSSGLLDLFATKGDPVMSFAVEAGVGGILGGLPTLIGVGLVWIGWRLIRPRRPRPLPGLPR
jgi:uncharacterized membrane protein YccC